MVQKTTCYVYMYQLGHTDAPVGAESHDKSFENH